MHHQMDVRIMREVHWKLMTDHEWLGDEDMDKVVARLHSNCV